MATLIDRDADGDGDDEEEEEDDNVEDEDEEEEEHREEKVGPDDSADPSNPEDDVHTREEQQVPEETSDKGKETKTSLAELYESAFSNTSYSSKTSLTRADEKEDFYEEKYGFEDGTITLATVLLSYSQLPLVDPILHLPLAVALQSVLRRLQPQGVAK